MDVRRRPLRLAANRNAKSPLCQKRISMTRNTKGRGLIEINNGTMPRCTGYVLRYQSTIVNGSNAEESPFNVTEI